MSAHILTVDDDALMRRSLAFTLEQAGYRVTTAGSAEDALRIVERDLPSLILLDIGLPGMDGLEGLRQLRLVCDAPIIFVTARRRELEQVLGLELGADDYVTKPFDSDVLLARIKAVLRRVQRSEPLSQSPISDLLTVGDLCLNPSAHLVTVNNHRVELAPREFDLLHFFMLSPGKVLSAEELLAGVWGAEFAGEPQVVYVHIRRLREKIEAEPSRPSRLVTVRGVGYKLVEQGA
ncbi:MAG: response regulator transcription factor [Caldilineaceae bacterium]|nr:response regulator transcription factor [Caldilineaceae bacterium]